MGNRFSTLPTDMAAQATRKVFKCGPLCPYDFEVRASIGDDCIDIYGWPSRGGVIILEDAQAIDFDFVGLDPLNPQLVRDNDKESEDAFCQRLLLLGARWWDSAARHSIVAMLRNGVDLSRNYRDTGRGPFPAPTRREKRWVSVAWPSTSGLWVAEFDTTLGEIENEDELPPTDLGLAKFRLAKTMDERGYLLKNDYQGKFYNSLDEYQGLAFLRAWEWKQTGEAALNLLTPDETHQEWARNLWTREDD